MSEIIREIRFQREVSHEGINEWLNQQLEYGRELRESNLEHILCKMEIASEKIGIPGPNSQDVDVVIPKEGIDENGYVKEVWVEPVKSINLDTEEIDGNFYEIIDPYVHNYGKWIQGFKTNGNGLINLLPSLKIVVRYMTSAISNSKSTQG